MSEQREPTTKGERERKRGKGRVNSLFYTWDSWYWLENEVGEKLD